MLGEWDTRHDPDCSEDYCADTIKTIPIERYFFPREYVEGNYKRHDILLIKLLWPVVFTGKYARESKNSSELENDAFFYFRMDYADLFANGIRGVP